MDSSFIVVSSIFNWIAELGNASFTVLLVKYGEIAYVTPIPIIATSATINNLFIMQDFLKGIKPISQIISNSILT